MAKDLRSRVKKASINISTVDSLTSYGATFIPNTIAIIPKQFVREGDPFCVNGVEVIPHIVTIAIYSKDDYEAGKINAKPLCVRDISYRNLDMRTYGTVLRDDVSVNADRRSAYPHATYTNRVGWDPSWRKQNIKGDLYNANLFLAEDYAIMCGDKSTHLIPAWEKVDGMWRIKVDEHDKIVWSPRALCLLEKMNEKGSPVLTAWINDTIKNELYESVRVK